MKPNCVRSADRTPGIFAGVLLAGALIAALSARADAASLFPSRVGVVGGGAAVAEPPITHGVSDGSGSLFIWSTDDQSVNQSLSLNVSSMTPGVIRLTGAAVFNPFVDVGIEGVSTNRWQGTGGGTVSADSIENVVGVAVTEGFGLDPAVAAFDPLHDTAASAWLFARVDYDVLALGSTEVSVGVGPVDIVDGGGSVAGAFSFGTITVEVIPEPQTHVAWVLMGLGGVLLRSRSSTRVV